MAVTKSTVWRVRPGLNVATTNDNGGGFDPSVAVPGTDYSQQNTAQVVYSDLVIDASVNTKLTSAANPFTSVHVGNVINIMGGTGFTVGRYVIVSVSAGVATCNDALGTTGSTGGTGKLGGGLPFSGVTSNLAIMNYATCKAGNIVYVLGSAGNASLFPSTGLDYSLMGYSSPGSGNDNDGFIRWMPDPIGPIPTIGCDGLTFYNGNFNSFENLYWCAIGNNYSNYGFITGGTVRIKNCVFNMNNYSVGACSIGSGFIINNYFSGGVVGSSNYHGISFIYTQPFSTLIMGNIFAYCQGEAINETGGSVIMNNIFFGGTGGAIVSSITNGSVPGIIANNTIDNNLGHGINVTNSIGTTYTRIYNNLITNHTGIGKAGIYIIYAAGINPDKAKIFCENNGFYNNTSHYSNMSMSPTDVVANPLYANKPTDWTPTNTALRNSTSNSFTASTQTSGGWIGAITPVPTSSGGTTIINRRRKVR